MEEFEGKTEEEIVSLLSQMTKEELRDASESVEIYLINNLNCVGPEEAERVADILSKLLWEDERFTQ